MYKHVSCICCRDLTWRNCTTSTHGYDWRGSDVWLRMVLNGYGFLWLYVYLWSQYIEHFQFVQRCEMGDATKSELSQRRQPWQPSTAYRCTKGLWFCGVFFVQDVLERFFWVVHCLSKIHWCVQLEHMCVLTLWWHKGTLVHRFVLAAIIGEPNKA